MGGGGKGRGGGGSAGGGRGAKGLVDYVRHVPKFLEAHAHLLGGGRAGRGQEEEAVHQEGNTGRQDDGGGDSADEDVRVVLCCVVLCCVVLCCVVLFILGGMLGCFDGWIIRLIMVVWKFSCAEGSSLASSQARSDPCRDVSRAARIETQRGCTDAQAERE